MKRIIAIVLAIVMVTAAMVGPVSAENVVVFETSLVPELENTTGTYDSVALEKGEVKVYSDGGYKVEIEGFELDGALFSGDLEVILWDIAFYGGNWQRKAHPDKYAAPLGTITLTDGEGTLATTKGSIYSGKHPGFVVQVTNPGVAYLLTSGFRIE